MMVERRSKSGHQGELKVKLMTLLTYHLPEGLQLGARDPNLGKILSISRVEIEGRGRHPNPMVAKGES